MNVFSFRAEFGQDVTELTNRLDYHGIPYQVDVSSLRLMGTDFIPPDVKVELHTDATQHSLEQIMLDVEDNHVMFQSLRPVPLAQNSLDRHHDRHGDD